MFVENKILPPDSRIWIFQSDRKLNDSEQDDINDLAKEFISSWTAHNKELRGGFEIRNGLFLIIYLDENHTMASGCSIDKSTHFIKKLEERFSLSLLNRNVFAFDQNGEINIIPQNKLAGYFSEGKINDRTSFFNNLIGQKSELDSSWKIPLGESWIKNLL